MKKLIVVAGTIGVIILQSCASDKKKETETIQNEEPTSQTAVTTSDSSQMLPPAQPLEINSSQPTISSTPVTAPVTATQGATQAGMNPAHGQPGHRCDIAVGAPLSSPPNKQTSTTPTISTTTPSVNSTTPTITPSTSTPQIQTTPVVSPAAAGPTPAGMNPPHGQPGHDCSVAVGAPLKK